MDPRIRQLNTLEARPDRAHVLYWLRFNQRAEGNHALHFASMLANRYELPLLVYQRLDCQDPYANDRRHTFLLEGVPGTAAHLRRLGIGYEFHLETQKAVHRTLPAAFHSAAAVVTDDWPEILAGPPPDFGVQAFAVDSSCVVPSACIPERCYAAYSIRPKIHKMLAHFLKPVEPVKLLRRYPKSLEPKVSAAVVSSCDIDHSVPPSLAIPGGRKEAERRLERFVSQRLRRYAKDRNEPSSHGTSELSPYLHAGYISALEVALAVRKYAEVHRLLADEFLEELIVRRELAFNFVRYAGRVDRLEVLPDWARATLAKHRHDRRDPEYTPEQFERAETYDDLWNATQKELRLRGKIHGYYRMYWGKKILEWSASPEEALATMLHLHDRYALDGQDPNTYANILWCFGLHDRPWPERPIYGTIRSMSRSGMDRKTDVEAYLREIEYLERTGEELIREDHHFRGLGIDRTASAEVAGE